MWSLSRAIGSRWRRGEHSYEFFFCPIETLSYSCFCLQGPLEMRFSCPLVKVDTYVYL